MIQRYDPKMTAYRTSPGYPEYQAEMARLDNGFYVTYDDHQAALADQRAAIVAWLRRQDGRPWFLELCDAIERGSVDQPEAGA